jgi:iron complex outermembrane recepter protein
MIDKSNKSGLMVSHTLYSALASGTLLALIPIAAEAQTQAAPDLAQDLASNEVASEVIITGSRIVRKNLTASSPVNVITADKLQAQSFENIADALAQQPQFAPSFGASRSQSTFSGSVSSGLNLVNLRNLGGDRTLTLVNGKRFPSGTITSEAVDFNMIPSANISRIEIMTGGAGAIYGADAVAGVINVITDNKFDGVEFGASYGYALEKKDNINPNAFVRMGKVFDKGFANLTLQYDYQGLVSCKDRYICAEDFSWFPPASPNRTPTARSGVGSTGRYFIDGNPTSYTLVDGQIVPFTVAAHGYNRNAKRDIAIPTERILLASSAEYEFADRHKAFLEFNYSSSKTEGRFEAHPFQSGTTDKIGGVLEPSIPTNNPFVPAALRTLAGADTEITWSQRFEGLGGRGATNKRDILRLVLGVKGKYDTVFGLGSDWNYEVSYQNGRSTTESNAEGLVSRANLYAGLRVEPVPGGTGFRCTDVIARASGCVPINPFDGYDATERAYLVTSAGARGEYESEIFQAITSGTLFDLPAGSVQGSFGLESRRVTSFLNYDDAINRGITTGNQIGDNEKRSYTTEEIFTEFVVPIVKDVPFAKSINFEGAYRVSSSSFGNYNTWKMGGYWSPLEGIRFRANKARSVRAPNLSETTGISQTFGTISDPCVDSRRTNNAIRITNCAADGVPVGYAPPLTVEQSVSGLVGGNANLKPEEAETLTYGVVFNASKFDAAPDWLKPLTITLDRFTIETTDLISGVGRQNLANLCYDTPASGRGVYCSQVGRGTDPVVPGATYVLKTVNDQVLNIATFDVSGIDFEANYTFEIGDILPVGDWGKINTTTTWTFYDKAEGRALPGGAIIDLLGSAGGSTSDQGWLEKQGTTSINWTKDRWKVNLVTRYIGKASAANFYPDVIIDSHVYHDARLSYRMQGTEIYIGVSNLTDQDPPFFPTSSSGTQALDTVPAYYDVYGRSIYAGFKARF